MGFENTGANGRDTVDGDSEGDAVVGDAVVGGSGFLQGAGPGPFYLQLDKFIIYLFG